jgi:predicted nucleic acid-binding Zn ribbon protein
MESRPRLSKSAAEFLREWYECDGPLDPDAGVQAAAGLVGSVLDSLGWRDGLDEEQVRAVWRDLAGEWMARHAEPVSVRNGQLVLKVTQPALRFQLEQMKPELLRKIRERIGPERVRSVRFALG